MSDILNELLNENKDRARIERFYKLFPIIVIIAIVIAIGIACYGWYQSNQTQKMQLSGDKLLQLVSNFKLEQTTHNNKPNDDSKYFVEKLQHFIDESKFSKQHELAILEMTRELLFFQKKDELIDHIVTTIEQDKSMKSTLTNVYLRIMYLSTMLDNEVISENDQQRIANYLSYFNQEEMLFFDLATLYKGLFSYKLQKYNEAKSSLLTIVNKDGTPLIFKQIAQNVLNEMENMLTQ